MDTTLRSWLYLYLGIIPFIPFSLRFLFQWVYSERQKKSQVPKIFWQLSLIGNTLFLIHFLIQVQYLFMLVQTINAVISWRNLNLMSKTPYKLKHVFWVLFICCSFTSSLFIAQSLYSFDQLEWQRIPLIPGIQNVSISTYWHLLGFLGVTLFSFRFWLQWWQSEKKKESTLPSLFWQISIAGAIMTGAYGLLTRDLILILGHGMGLLPYVRNLILISKTS